MDNEQRVAKEVESYARFCSYIIGAHFKGRTNTQLEKILVTLTGYQKQLVNGVILEDTDIFMAEMISSFIDGIRGKKLPGI